MSLQGISFLDTTLFCLDRALRTHFIVKYFTKGKVAELLFLNYFKLNPLKNNLFFKHSFSPSTIFKKLHCNGGKNCPRRHESNYKRPSALNQLDPNFI